MFLLRTLKRSIFVFKDYKFQIHLKIGHDHILSSYMYLFICGLFNGAVSISEYVASNDRVINELEKVWRKAAVV
jgi:hypothetical protein